jgi:hypothetical protein
VGFAEIDFNIKASLKCHGNTLSSPAHKFNRVSHAVSTRRQAA